jgi:hypothetical protein
VGGLGSGEWDRSDAKRTVHEYRSIDVRRWPRDGLLRPGCSFVWGWSVNDEVVAMIAVRVKRARLILAYRFWETGKTPEIVAKTVPA